jgi:hypothetical protein
MHWARCLSRKTEKGKAYGVVTAKALAVLEALLWAFHTARSGLCFPSPKPPQCRPPGLSQANQAPGRSPQSSSRQKGGPGKLCVPVRRASRRGRIRVHPPLSMRAL